MNRSEFLDASTARRLAAKKMYEDDKMTLAQVAEIFHISRAAASRLLKVAGCQMRKSGRPKKEPQS